MSNSLILAFFLQQIHVRHGSDYNQCPGRQGEGVIVGPAHCVTENKQRGAQADGGETRVADVFLYHRCSHMPAKILRNIKTKGNKNIKYHPKWAVKGKNKLKLTIAYIINDRYLDGKEYLCTAFCKIINKLIN